MAVTPLISYTGITHKWDDTLQKFIMNPRNDAGLFALTGWNSTELSIQELHDLHNGTTRFTGRSGFSGDAETFPILVLKSGGVISNTTQVKVKVDRDPTITYTELTLSKEDMTDNGDGTFYIDVPYVVDSSFVYENDTEVVRWYFPEDTFGDVVQSITFTDPDTGRSHTENYIIEYKEDASAEYMTMKVWDFTDDEFLITDELESGLQETNSTPAGDLVLQHRSTPVYTDNVNDVYFDGEEEQFPKEISPLMGLSVDCTSDSPYLASGTNIDNLFKPEAFWSISVIIQSGSYGYGRLGATEAQRTGVRLNAGTLGVYIGGTFEASATTYDHAKPVFIQQKNYWNGSAWVDDLIVNNVVIRSGNTANRGTTTSSVLPIFCGRWTVDSHVDPMTDGQSFNGGEFNALRISTTTEPTLKNFRHAFYLQKHYFIDVVLGSSTMDESTIATQLQADGWVNNHRTQVLNFAQSGATFYQYLADTPPTGFSVKPPWVTNSRPAITVSLEDIEDQCDMNKVTDFFPYNFLSVSYVEKNTSATGSKTVESEIGFNDYTDEHYWGALYKKAHFDNAGITFVMCGPNANRVTTLGCGDEDLSRYEGAWRSSEQARLDPPFENYIPMQYYFQTSEANHIGEASLFNVDNIHLTNDGADLGASRILALNTPISDSTRDFYFYPEIKYISPVDGATVFEDPANIQWSHDEVVVNDTEDVDEGLNNVTRVWTGIHGKYVEKTISIEKKMEPDFTERVFHLPLNAVVDDGGTDKFLADDGSGYEAIVTGVPTIDNGRWKCTLANVDTAVVQGSTSAFPNNARWAYNVWAQKDELDQTYMYIFGSDGGDRMALQFNGEDTLRHWTYDTQITYAGDFSLEDEHMYSLEYRFSVPDNEWVLDLFLDGVFKETQIGPFGGPASGNIRISGRDPGSFTLEGWLRDASYFEPSTQYGESYWAELYAYENT